jgi:hypothetical protein
MAKKKRKAPQLVWDQDDNLCLPQQDLFLGCQPYCGAYDSQGIVTDAGVFSTDFTTASPRSEGESSGYSPVTLSQTLETEADWLARHPGSTSQDWWTYLRRYFLSPVACAGILRRAAARSRTLPPELQVALEAIAAQQEEEPQESTP